MKHDLPEGHGFIRQVIPGGIRGHICHIIRIHGCVNISGVHHDSLKGFRRFLHHSGPQLQGIVPVNGIAPCGKVGIQGGSQGAQTKILRVQFVFLLHEPGEGFPAFFRRQHSPAVLRILVSCIQIICILPGRIMGCRLYGITVHGVGAAFIEVQKIHLREYPDALPGSVLHQLLICVFPSKNLLKPHLRRNGSLQTVLLPAAVTYRKLIHAPCLQF